MIATAVMLKGLFSSAPTISLSGNEHTSTCSRFVGVAKSSTLYGFSMCE
ncbi:MAG TPA: hypothetical protein PKD00_01685 [Burkholderiales bacterium]|nr:hypothetical protein [Burkholderiales bacterium]